jgi:hypothetical protein
MVNYEAWKRIMEQLCAKALESPIARAEARVMAEKGGYTREREQI